MKVGYFGYKNVVHGLFLLGKHEGFGGFFKGKPSFFINGISISSLLQEINSYLTANIISE